MKTYFVSWLASAILKSVGGKVIIWFRSDIYTHWAAGANTLGQSQLDVYKTVTQGFYLMAYITSRRVYGGVGKWFFYWFDISFFLRSEDWVQKMD